MLHRYLFLALTVLATGCCTFHNPPCNRETGVISVGPFHHTDSSGHRTQIQQCLDQANGQAVTFRFAPGDYLLSDAEGLRAPSHAILLMDGARFFLAKEIRNDGQAFRLENVTDISMQGGEIIGARDAWDPGTNVAGIRISGKSSGIRLTGLLCRELTSNAVGIFGESVESPIRDVTLTHVSAIHCCNVYVDYLQPGKGPAPGSDRCDQGAVAFYHVENWAVEACRWEGSESDGTHFFQCRNGRFTHNTVRGSRMGGYFLEGCENVLADANLILDNGSRGVTIERDSRYCTLSSNLITHSGREGLWMPDAYAIQVTGNLFVENGQKDDGEKDCEIRLDDTDEYAAAPRDIRIENNVFRTLAHQTAVVYIAPGIDGINVENNTFEGPAAHTAVKQ